MQCCAAPPQCNTRPAARSGGQSHVLQRCVVCRAELVPYAEINTAHLQEPFFQPQLRTRLPALVYRTCRDCGSIWACDARRDATVLRRCYEASSATYWAHLSADRRLFAKVSALLERHAPGRLLCDVGCGDGKLLVWLPSKWIKHGLEPAPAAVQLCRPAGLAVELGTPSHTRHRGEFDAITCIDTLEHMLDPAAELAGMAAMLRPGGVLLVATGDARAWTARLAADSWEYLHCVGHVSVLSRTAVRRLLTDAGLVVAAHSGLSHSGGVSVPVWFADFLRNYRRGLRGRKFRRMPYCRDHQLALARKPAG
jgi:2-polyprenyl-3-methyl-5-hydroxy-6-metoxy-1,4-benzoquinol methylase